MSRDGRGRRVGGTQTWRMSEVLEVGDQLCVLTVVVVTHVCTRNAHVSVLDLTLSSD